MRGEQAIFNLEIKKKSGLSINPDIHHSKVFSSVAFSYNSWNLKKFTGLEGGGLYLSPEGSGVGDGGMD